MNPQNGYRALRETAGLIDVSTRGKIEVSGADRAEFLHNILTQEIKSLQPGQSTYAALLTAQAKILADMNVFIFEDRILLGTEPGVEKKLLPALEHFIITEDVVLKDVTAESGHLAVEGPHAESFVSGLPGAFVVDRGFTGRKAFGFPVLKNQLENLKREILGRGAAETGAQELEAARVEWGWLRYGIDMDENTPLPETGLDDVCVSETKGCYPGQEVVARTKTYKGLLRKMVRVLVAGKEIPKSGDKILRDGKEIGRVTSACLLPSGKAAGLGYVAKGFFENPGEVILACGEKKIGAKTSPLL